MKFLPDLTASLAAVYLNENQMALAMRENGLVKLALEKIQALLPGKTVYCNAPVPGTELIKAGSETGFLVSVMGLLPPSQIPDEDIDETFLAFFRGFSPLLDLELSKELLTRHCRYLAQYSWSENIPSGLIPFFISREFIETLPDNALVPHDFLIKNINQYDVEIFYHPPDLRQYRLDFTLSGQRSLKLINHFINKNNPAYADILDEIKQHPEIFRPFPSWIELEIYSGCDYTCTFCPRQFSASDRDGIMLSPDNIKTIANWINQASMDPVTVCLGGMGEPLLHPELPQIITEFVSVDNTAELIIETSLSPDITILKNTLSQLTDAEKQKLSLIINLVTLDPKKYQGIYGRDSLQSTLAKTGELADILGKNRINVQMIKMKEVEEEVEKYFNHFEKAGYNVILQKYNRYADLMPEKRVSDLTPIKREFCWHLVRDLYIRSDGAVSACRVKMDASSGNINTANLNDIWQNGLPSAGKSLNDDHSVTTSCLQCDEWYTFNG